MKILIFNGSTAEHSKESQRFGLVSNGAYYGSVLQEVYPGCQYYLAHPSELGAEAMPDGLSFSELDGIVITGSPLNIYNDCEVIRNQRKFGEIVLKSGLPIFASCWGLQLLSELLGGKVAACKNGRELGIARHIRLNEQGAVHPLLAGRSRSFDVLAVHLDEVVRCPSKAVVLATNEHSEVQAMAYKAEGLDIWAVQYHPEYSLTILARIFRREVKAFTAEGFFANKAGVEATADDWEAIDQNSARSDIAFRYGIGPDILDKSRHRQELYNWFSKLRAETAAH